MLRKNGYTLIELMIVVALIAVMAVFAVPMYQSYIAKSYEEQAKAAMKELAARAEQTKAINFTYYSAQLTPPPAAPPSYLGLYHILLNSSGGLQAGDGSGISEPHMDIEIHIPADGKSYTILGKTNQPDPIGTIVAELNSAGQSCIMHYPAGSHPPCQIGVDPEF